MSDSQSRSSKRVCQWKVRHANESSARKHAQDLALDKGKPIGTWHAYDCPHCTGWHVGRPGTPRYDVTTEPRDPTLHDAIGRRAYIAGTLENHVRESTRSNYMKRLASKVYWKQWRKATGMVEGRYLQKRD